MTVPPYEEDPEKVRPCFREMRELFRECQAGNSRIRILSMGMSHDFRVAIEEGANMVRVGSAIFGERI